MVCRDFQDMKLSALGLGAIRLPVAGDHPDAPIDEEHTAQMVDYALSHGINYFDTAYGYHGGESERVMGRILGRYPRDSYYLADKFPGYDLSNMDKVEAIFEEQRPDACVGCKSCEAVCPQQLEIAAAMTDFVGKLNQTAGL